MSAAGCPVLSVHQAQAMITGGSSFLSMDRSIPISWTVLSFSRNKVNYHLDQLREEHAVAWDDAQCMCRFSVRHRHLQGSDSQAVRVVLLAIARILLKPKSIFICWINCKPSPCSISGKCVSEPCLASCRNFMWNVFTKYERVANQMSMYLSSGSAL